MFLCIKCNAILFDDSNSGSQSFYLEHNDDIISIAVNEHPKFKSIVATGQIGEKPFIKVWNAGSKKNLSVMQGFHTMGVCALDFSCSGKMLLSVGLDAAHSLAVWNWQEGPYHCYSFIHSGYFYSTSASPLRGVPDYSIDTASELKCRNDIVNYE